MTASPAGIGAGELLPCPFCGEPPRVGELEAVMFVGVHGDRADHTAAAWNTRAALTGASA